MMNREWGQTGQNYLRSLLALGFQAFMILVCVAIYAALIGNITVSDDISYEALHTTGTNYIIADIEQYIQERQAEPVIN